MKQLGHALESCSSFRLLMKPIMSSAKLFYVSAVIACQIFIANCWSPCFASSPVAVLKSARNVNAYQDQHLGTFDDDWLAIGRTLGAANINYEEISDAEVSFGLQRIGGYKVIIIPQLVDLPQSVVAALVEFERVGGKLIMTDSGGTPLPQAQQIEQLAGVSITGQT